MSRREDRISDSKRHRFRFDREPSPKRYRRDSKRDSERPNSNNELDKQQQSDRRDHKHSTRRLQDPLPLEAPLKRDAKIETERSVSENKTNGRQGDGSKHSSDSSKVPQSQSFFQHDDRGSAGQNGRSSGGRTENARGWWRDPKEQLKDPRKEERAKDNREDNHVWRHDGYLKMEANSKPRKRPSFREQKLTSDIEKTDQGATDTPKGEDPILENGRNKRGQTYRHSEKPETESSRGNFSSRDKYTGSNRYIGNDRFSGSQGYNRPSGGRAEKWKHDLYDDANKSPTPKNEEEHIAKIEALLSS